MVTPIDDPDEVLAYLSEPIRAITDGLDHGVSLADAKMADMAFDQSLWSHLVRHGTRSELAQAESTEWRLGRRLHNSGIEVARGDFVIRVMKAHDAGPPPPGHSHARKEYFQQTQQMRLDLDLNANGQTFCGANLILDWDVAKDRSLLVGLSKPIGLWRYKDQPKTEWRRRIDVSGPDLAFTPADEDLDVQPLYDPNELEATDDVER